MTALRVITLAVSMAALAACGGGSSGGRAQPASFCAAAVFTAPDQSPYALPYAVGATFRMFQGNCPANPAWGHRDMLAYDFDLPMGTPVHAARAGTVIRTEDRYSDDDHIPGHENMVVVQHADGTMFRYAHLRLNGVAVVLGTAVAQGELLGFSGNSGSSSGPHLHADLLRSGGDGSRSSTLPLTFSNAGGRTMPSGELIQDEAYTALPVN